MNLLTRSSENQIDHAEHHEQADQKDDADDPQQYFHGLCFLGWVTS
jgi:hypothetical protein